MSRFRLTALLLVSSSTAFAQYVAAPESHGSLITWSQPSASASIDGAVAATGGAEGGILAPAAEYTRPFSRLGVGVKVGILGIGFQAATPLNRCMNLSGGANFFSYTDNLTSDGIHYNANLRLRSAETSLDFFPFAGSFHISPGALLYNGNQLIANASVPGGQSFTLNDVDYQSSVTDPVTGSGSLKFNQAAPKLTVGFGNMLPRNGRHFSFPVEVGFAYVGDPKVLLNLKGTACDPTGLGCQDVSTNSQIQANIAGQQLKIQNDVSPARFFPIFSMGFAANF